MKSLSCSGDEEYGVELCGDIGWRGRMGTTCKDRVECSVDVYSYYFYNYIIILLGVEGDQVSGGKRGRWCQRNSMREWAATHIGRVGVLCNRHVGQVKDVRDGWLCPVHNSLVSTCV